MSYFQQTKLQNSAGTVIDPATSGNQTTGNASLTSIDTKITNASQKSQIVDASGNVIASTTNALHVNVQAAALPTGAATAANQTGGTQKTQLVDAAGDVASVSSDGALQVEDRMLSIAEGDVTGHSLMLKFGRNPDIDAAAAEDVWEGGGNYTFDTTAQSLEILSSDADDDGDPAGTGARTVTVIGLDADYLPKTETVTMNGTTAVALSGTWMRVHRCSVTTAGSSEVNEGTLTVRIAGGGATRLVVGIGNGQTLMAVYTIPAGKTGYLYHYYCSGNATPTAPTMDVSLWTRSSTGVRNLKHQQALSAGAELTYTFAAPFAISEKTDIWLRASSSVNNADVCGGFDIVLVDN